MRKLITIRKLASHNRINNPVILSLVYIALISLIGCTKQDEQASDGGNNPLAPIAEFTFTPELVIEKVTSVKFDASGCMDDEDPLAILLVRWDFDNDGVFDTEFSFEKNAEYIFNDPGDITVLLEVRDTDGNIGKKVRDVFVDSISNYPPCFAFSEDIGAISSDTIVSVGSKIKIILGMNINPYTKAVLRYLSIKETFQQTLQIDTTMRYQQSDTTTIEINFGTHLIPGTAKYEFLLTDELLQSASLGCEVIFE